MEVTLQGGASLAGRQDQTTPPVIIPATYGPSWSPSPGVIVAIVLGSVAAFLLLLLLVYAALGFGRHRGTLAGSDYSSGSSDRGPVAELSVVGSRHFARRHGPATRQKTPSTKVDSRSRPAVHRPQGSARRHAQPHVQPHVDSHVDADHIVVIEEHSPPPPTVRHPSRSYSHGHGYSRSPSRSRPPNHHDAAARRYRSRD
ncbi:hypothetical protein CDD82_3757 [Ophiocordyceps australis]|uniref:Uncharacterized protein n=1 Tax=Ophiocordyceps australis TaxID=1399860 RepID=A0A2C5Z505_9HYPO|nr:hypothetical protein CDD82_3757 [Ophiocordyceps australis]